VLQTGSTSSLHKGTTGSLVCATLSFEENFTSLNQKLRCCWPNRLRQRPMVESQTPARVCIGESRGRRASGDRDSMREDSSALKLRKCLWTYPASSHGLKYLKDSYVRGLCQEVESSTRFQDSKVLYFSWGAADLKQLEQPVYL
jgi:hypothetical protein